MDYTVGIIGGVGSDSSAYFYKKILDKTKVTKDQEHLNMIILNHATIPDRTFAIKNSKENSVIEKISEDIRLLNNIAVKDIVIACNTAHTFYDKLQEVSEVPIYHLIKNTASYLKEKEVKKVAILATTGSLEAGVYQSNLEKYGLYYEIPTEELQNDVMQIIYEQVKVGKPADREQFNKIVNYFSQRGINNFILGCTELSMLKDMFELGENFIDPLDIAAEYLIVKNNKEIRR